MYWEKGWKNNWFCLPGFNNWPLLQRDPFGPDLLFSFKGRHTYIYVYSTIDTWAKIGAISFHFHGAGWALFFQKFNAYDNKIMYVNTPPHSNSLYFCWSHQPNQITRPTLRSVFYQFVVPISRFQTQRHDQPLLSRGHFLIFDQQKYKRWQKLKLHDQQKAQDQSHDQLIFRNIPPKTDQQLDHFFWMLRTTTWPTIIPTT